VVLQGFNSVLTMLDARGGGAGAIAAMPEDDGTGYTPSGNGSGAKRGAASAPGKGFDKAVDDEIPF